MNHYNTKILIQAPVLERLASVLQVVKQTFETDLIFPIIEATAKRAGVKYNEDPNTDVF